MYWMAAFCQPSKIAEEHQRPLSAEFHALRLPEGGIADSVLLFRRSPQLGANAFTLPDGTIIVLDDLITALGRRSADFGGIRPRVGACA